jgi:hypothetical protein
MAGGQDPYSIVALVNSPEDNHVSPSPSWLLTFWWYIKKGTLPCLPSIVGRDSSVDIATGSMAWVRFPLEAKFFFSLQRQNRLWGPPSLLSIGYRGLFLRPGHKADHYHVVPGSRKVGLYLHASYSFITCLIEHRGSFTSLYLQM